MIDIKDEDHGGRGFTCRDSEDPLWSFGRVPYPGVARREVPGRVIVNPLDVGRRGQPQGEKPARDGNADIRILTSNFGFFILLPGKRTLAILLTGFEHSGGRGRRNVGPRAIFRCIACAATLTPPTPPSQGGESRRSLVFFSPLAKGGRDTGGFFECLCVAPSSASRRLKIALNHRQSLLDRCQQKV